MAALCGITLMASPGYAQSSAQQKVSEQERARELDEQQKRLLREIERKRPTPEIEEKAPEEAKPAPPSEKVLIKKINVVGVTMLPEKGITALATPFENTELSVRDMQKVADTITDAYRAKGYITSRAYLPPQKIENGILEIRIIEGRMGGVEVKGNRYFKAPLYIKRILLRKGEPFNYNILRRSLVKINERPDRNAKAVLMPGKEPGTTDIVLEVKETFPVHAGFDWDNFGTRYIENNRYQWRATHNNLLGLDDIFTFLYWMSEADSYKLFALRYLIPVTRIINAGFFGAHTEIDLGREFKQFDVYGKSRIYSLFSTASLVDEDAMSIVLNAGFDYKDTFNYQQQREVSRDRMRVLKFGIDEDMSDAVSRTIFTNELDIGIPEFMNGSARKDFSATRTGSGGQFVKYVMNLLRNQRMPFSSSLLWRNQLQVSPYILTATEQYQIGGASSVRGYPPAEFVGDSGYSTSIEYYIPPYGIPKYIKIPFSKAKLYDAFRIVGFYDLGIVWLKRPEFVNEFKNKTLTSAGWGLRLNLPENFFMRLDFGWALDDPPSEGDRLHTWIQVSKSF